MLHKNSNMHLNATEFEDDYASENSTILENSSSIRNRPRMHGKSNWMIMTL